MSLLFHCGVAGVFTLRGAPRLSWAPSAAPVWIESTPQFPFEPSNKTIGANVSLVSGRRRSNIGATSYITLERVLSWGNRPPIYPRIAQENGWEGTVTLRLSAKKLELARSSGYEVLDESALKSARNWNIPVSETFLLPVAFALAR